MRCNMFKVVSTKNNAMSFINTFTTNDVEKLNLLDACSCTGNSACQEVMYHFLIYKWGDCNEVQ